MAGKRSIFEEVAAQPQKQALPAGGMIEQGARGARPAIRIWLALLFLMVAAMIIIGGLTRLTGSGLSITEWRPLTGAIPPMNAADWAAEFTKYQQIAQFQLTNATMTVEEFKLIYWWEWGHRQLGRAVGLIWALGFVYFLIRRQIPAGWTGRLLLVGGLGGLQGAIGWWMVYSGVDSLRISVAPYRLATHLGLAFIILGFLGWYVLLLSRSEAQLMTARRGREAKLFSMSTGLMHFAFLQILLGALVAGTDAGTAFPTWPLMNGSFIPSDIFYVTDLDGNVLPAWHAFFEGQGMTQFMHRMAGYLLISFGLVVWLRGRKSVYRETRQAFHAVMIMLVLQMLLGIYSALTLAQLHVAITHQLGAILLWVLILRARYLSQYPIAGSIRKGTA
ncbi:heme A synthase [Pseudogemmobacter faecipullorum]|uniref:Heme A synthase n=1 Tax=Pseudogemmobacter faecipullorum TaxID=2755041 RepID=A0ABS8CL95_9RHOB|nr:heme A synthase [Pseudogemmobacter faecipullorum]MCB5410140.1 COX15/CtaA family protein [Pseudogemmobacter faecipullorum]